MDVRIIAATNRDLASEVAGGKFPRGPLLSPQRRQHRDAAAPRSPERSPAAGDALPRSASRRRTASAIDGFADDAVERITGYRWPGNVRELENIIERAVVLCDGSKLTAKHLPAGVSAGDAPGYAHPGLDMAEIERHAIVTTLEAVRRTHDAGGADARHQRAQDPVQAARVRDHPPADHRNDEARVALSLARRGQRSSADPVLVAPVRAENGARLGNSGGVTPPTGRPKSSSSRP